jgi:hypothetical protein
MAVEEWMVPANILFSSIMFLHTLFSQITLLCTIVISQDLDNSRVQSWAATFAESHTECATTLAKQKDAKQMFRKLFIIYAFSTATNSRQIQNLCRIISGHKC